MKFSHREVTTSRSINTKSLWVEVRPKFFHEITQKVLQCNIPNELTINADQTPFKCVATENITVAAQAEKHVSRRGSPQMPTFCKDSVWLLMKNIRVMRLKKFV